MFLQPSKESDALNQYTSNQLLSVLDHLLQRAIHPLFLTSNVVSDYLAELLPLVITDARRKVSSLPKDIFYIRAFNALTAKDEDVRWLAFISLQIERNQLFDLLYRTMDMCSNYCRNQVYHLTRNRRLRQNAKLEQMLRAKPQYFYAALQESKYWLKLAVKHKNLIQEKYLRHAYKEAYREAKSPTRQISFEDLFGNYCLAISKSVDKTDANQGTLTTVVNFWFKNSNINPEHSHQLGLAYSIPTSKRRSLQKSNWMDGGVPVQNWSSSIEEAEEIASHETQPLMTRNTDILRYLPEAKWQGILYGVAFPLSEEEKALLAATL